MARGRSGVGVLEGGVEGGGGRRHGARDISVLSHGLVMT